MIISLILILTLILITVITGTVPKITALPIVKTGYKKLDNITVDSHAYFTTFDERTVSLSFLVSGYSVVIVQFNHFSLIF